MMTRLNQTVRLAFSLGAFWIVQELPAVTELQPIWKVGIGHYETGEFSPDGSVVATSLQRNGAVLWDGNTGAFIRKIDSSSNGGVAFNANGSVIHLGGDGAYDVNTGVKVYAYDPQPFAECIDVSPTGDHVATGDHRSGEVFIHSADTGLLITTLLAHAENETIVDVEFSPDGLLLATASSDGTAKVWNTETWTVAFERNDHDDSYYGSTTNLLFNPVEDELLIRTEDSVIAVDTVDGDLLRSYGIVNGKLGMGIDLTRGTLLLASGTHIYTYEYINGVEESSISWSKLPEQSHTVFSPDTARFIAMRDIDPLASIHLCSRADNSTIAPLQGLSVINVDGGIVSDTCYVIGWSGTASLISEADGTLVKSFRFSTSYSDRALVLPIDETLIAAYQGTMDGKLRYYDTATESLLSITEEGHPDEILDMVLSPDGTMILTGCGDGFARLFDAASGDLIHTFQGSNNGVYAVQFMPDNSACLVPTDIGEFDLYDVVTGSSLGQFSATSTSLLGEIQSFSVSSDGTLIYAAGTSVTQCFETTSSTPLRMITGGGDIALSPDDQFLVLPSRNRVSHAETGIHIATMRLRNVERVQWAKDGKRIVTVEYFGETTMWDFQPISQLQPTSWSTH